MSFVYYGHHKCASTWIRTIVEEVFRESGHTYGMVLDPKSPNAQGPLTDYRTSFERTELGTYFDENGLDFLSCITADQAQADALDGTHGFHVIRDPRDVIVSGYFSHRNSHPTDGLPHLEKHRQNLQSVSKEEGLFLEMEFSAQCLHNLASWNYNQDPILEVKMEDLTSRPYEGFLEIFEFLGLMSWDGVFLMREKAAHFARTALNRLANRHPMLDGLRRPTQVTGEMLLGRVYDHRFEKKTSGRSRGQSDANSHYRKGVAGDWVNHFTPAHAEYFIEQFGDILLTTGYESSNDWVESMRTDETPSDVDAPTDPVSPVSS